MSATRHPFRLERTRRGSRGGVTLLELLAVITIMLMITAAAIPMLVTSLQGRQIREAARQVSAYLAGARARAIETGRPVGVAFPPKQQYTNFPNPQRYATNLYYVEVPPPYSGDVTGAACTVSVLSVATPATPGLLSFTMTPAGTFNSSLVAFGDYIKLNYRGFLYQITSPGPTPVLATYYYGQATAYENNPNLTVPYQVFHQPVKSAAAPLQLPEGAVVDISAMHSDAYYPFQYDPPMLLFSATGTLAYIYDGANQTPTASTAYMLIGRPDEMMPPQNAQVSQNVLDLDSLWIAVGYQTGEISTAENASISNPGGMSAAQVFPLATRFVKSAQGMGGR
jgi:type II secretory pathway pseudopilin PulG